MSFEKFTRERLIATLGFAMFGLFLSNVDVCLAQPDQKSFSSAEEASQALYSAVRGNDDKALNAILGTDDRLISSDERVQDLRDREQFVPKYQEMHRLVREPDRTVVLYIGAENWPFPIALKYENGAWRFDARAGVQEVLFRRIGENELTAIQTCHALVAAAKDGGQVQSERPTAALHTLLVNAGDEGLVPFHGYYFRRLTSHRISGATSASDRTSAFSRSDRSLVFVAYPAEYRSTGVMTYLVTEDDVVYEKDLGPETVKIAKGVTPHALDSTWYAAE